MDRVAKLRNCFPDKTLDALLVLQPENRCYLSGFSGSAGALLITASEALLFTDFRYVEQAEAQAPGFTVVKHGTVIWDEVVRYTSGLARIGFEQDFVTWAQHKLLGEKFNGIELVPVCGLVESLRSTKDASELLALQKAADLADAAFTHILTFIDRGKTEKEIALELEFFMRRNGATGTAFDFIVASGPRSSLPHGVAADRVISDGDLVTMDFGAVVEGYCSDITRTVLIGSPSPKQSEVYHIVLETQVTALKAIKPGMTGREADSVARRIISSHGYGENFGHGLGHGVGLVVHEEPRLSPAGESVLVPGMVVTVEPGIYLPGWGGVRIEDTAVITSSGCRPLTHSPKDLILI